MAALLTGDTPERVEASSRRIDGQALSLGSDSIARDASGHGVLDEPPRQQVMSVSPALTLIGPDALLGRRSALPLSDWRRAARSAFARASGRLQRDVLALVRLLALVALASGALAARSVVPAAVLDVPVAAAVAAALSVVCLALLQLEVVRFRALKRSPDLLVGGAFGLTAVANLLIGAGLAALGLGVEAWRLEILILLSLVCHGLAFALFAIAVVHYGRALSPGPHQVWLGRLGNAAPLVLLIVGSVLVFGQPGLLAALETTALLLLAVFGVGLLANREADGHLAVLTFGLSLLALSKLHGLLVLPQAPGYVGLSDLFQLAAYLALLFHLVSRITRDVAEGASAEERKRLSRDLHDGLAQNLSVLNMRLNEAIRVCPDPVAASLGRNLQASRRLAQAALFEARHAITALRTGSIGWDDCVEALETLCNEWSQNLEVDIRLRVEGTLAAVNAELHVELLRILNEAISNAVRHGQATCIEVWLAVAARPTRLILRVQDDGHGFSTVWEPNWHGSRPPLAG